jgi:hypothetical protein
MADIYSKVEAYNASGVNNAGATVGANSRKFGEDTFRFGTRNISPLVIVASGGEFANAQNSNSNFYKVMTVVQSRCEIFGIGDASTTQVTLFVADDTLYADEGNARAPTTIPDIDLLQDEIFAATGITVNVYNGKIENDDVNYNDC